MFSDISKILSKYDAQRIEFIEYEDEFKIILYYGDLGDHIIEEIQIPKKFISKKNKKITDMFSDISKILSKYNAQKIEFTEYGDEFRLRLYYVDRGYQYKKEIHIMKELILKKHKKITDMDLLIH